MTAADPVRIDLRSHPRLLSGAREFVSAAARRWPSATLPKRRARSTSSGFNWAASMRSEIARKASTSRG